MKKSRFSETQIVSILQQQQAGLSVADICRQQNISEATFYKWKARYGGMQPAEIKRLQDLQAENHKLKQMYAELSLDNHILKEALAKKW